jgi:hypothetical protein
LRATERQSLIIGRPCSSLNLYLCCRSLVCHSSLRNALPFTHGRSSGATLPSHDFLGASLLLTGRRIGDDRCVADKIFLFRFCGSTTHGPVSDQTDARVPVGSFEIQVCYAMLCCDLLSLAARGEISASQNQRDSTTGTGQGATRESPVKLLEDQIRGKIKGCRRELVHVLTRPLAQNRQGALGWLTERPGVLIPAFQFFGSSCAVSGLWVRQKTLVTRWHRSCWMPPPYERGSPRSCRE